jgi:hypothetical protein
VDKEPHDQQLLDCQLLDLEIVAGQPASPQDDQPVDKFGHRPVQQRKRKQVAIETVDKPVKVRAPSLRHKRQKRTD